MSDHDTADRALVERLKMHARVVGQSGVDTGNEVEISVADDMVKAAAALARRIAEGERLAAADAALAAYDLKGSAGGARDGLTEPSQSTGTPHDESRLLSEALDACLDDYNRMKHTVDLQREQFARETLARSEAEARATQAEQRAEAYVRDLAECYRLCGADPDGNEDWRLAREAVSEVRRLREAVAQANAGVPYTGPPEVLFSMGTRAVTCSPANMATLLDALTAAQEQGYTRVGHDDVSLLEDGCGLSIDMLDADRLRVWADKLAEHGPNVSHFASVTWMQGELARLSQAIAAQVRDVGRLRAALARRIAEGARLKEAAEEFLRYHMLDCGAHFCRYCSARSPEWEHAEHCSFVLSQSAYTKLRAALMAEEPPR